MEGSSLNYGSLGYGSSFPAVALDGTGALDTFPVNTSTDYVTSQDMNLVQDTIMNIEKKIGIDNSLVVTSLDYILKNTTGGHDHDGSDSKKLSGFNSTHFTSLSGAAITNLDPTHIGVGDLSITGNISVTGTVDGVDVSTFKTDYDAKVNQDVRTTASPTFSNVEILKALVPIGSIIPFYDFNGALTFDTNYWTYCDGSAQTIGGSSRTTPDLSNRYLVGFGTEGGGDIDSAAWATTIVGNASHQANIAHTHSVPSHYHGRGTLSITTGGTNSGQHVHTVRIQGGGGSLDSLSVGHATQTTTTFQTESGAGGEHIHSNDTFLGSVGNTGGVDGDSAMTSGSGGSATQSIQPRSVQVRFIMRKA